MKLASVLVASALVAVVVQPAAADDDTDAGSTGDGFWARSVERDQGPPSGGSGRTSSTASGGGPPITLGDGACDAAASVAGAFFDVTFCQQYAEPTTPVLTVGLIRTAFAELRLPAGELVIQPPDGLTLVNFDTNFYTTSTEPIARTVTLLGRRVTLEATPSTFHWIFGDGESLTTSDPGAPYPQLRVTHNYLRKGTYRPSLATTYTGRYRVGGGPWRQIPGTVTIDGTGQALRAIEAEPKLVSY